MLHPLRPRHFADVDEAFDSLLEFYERAVVGHADDASADVRSLGIAVLRIQPWIRRQLLESERNALLIFVVLENLDLDLIAHIHQILGVSEASPRHVGDMEEPVKSTKIDERAVLSQILDNAGEDRALFQMLQRLGALLI